jgi:hypothetical protein
LGSAWKGKARKGLYCKGLLPFPALPEKA